MIDRRCEANRLNALKSTGPLTLAGKAASSQNNRKHGLAAGIFDVLPTESQEDFDAYAAELEAELQPKSLLQRTLVMKMAQHYWLGQRAVSCQNHCFQPQFGPVVGNRFLMQQMALYLRYQAHHDRAYHKCLAELRAIQAASAKETRAQELHTRQLAQPQGARTPRHQPPAKPPQEQHITVPASVPVATAAPNATTATETAATETAA